MKKLLPFLLLLIALPSCEDNENDDSNSPTLKNNRAFYIYAEIEGKQFNAASVSTGGELDIIQITAKSSSSDTYPQLVMSFTKNSIPMTYLYPIDFTQSEVFFSPRIFYILNDSVYYIFNQGMADIKVNDTINKRFEVTFEGTFYEDSSNNIDSLEVKNGEFKANYN